MILDLHKYILKGYYQHESLKVKDKKCNMKIVNHKFGFKIFDLLLLPLSQ
jgi:hypothetical protein